MKGRFRIAANQRVARVETRPHRLILEQIHQPSAFDARAEAIARRLVGVEDAAAAAIGQEHHGR